MSVQQLSAAVVLQILEQVAPNTHQHLRSKLSAETLHTDMRKLSLEDVESELAIVQMVQYALQHRQHKQLLQTRVASATQTTSSGATVAASLMRPLHSDTGVSPSDGSVVDKIDGSTDIAQHVGLVLAPHQPTEHIVAADEEVDEVDLDVGMTTHQTGAQTNGTAFPAARGSAAVQGEASDAMSSPRTPLSRCVHAAQALLSGLPVRVSELPAADLARMRLILFGHGGQLGGPDLDQVRVRTFSQEWTSQALAFSDLPGLRYMLSQSRGGPCGPLAVINAEACRFLYYSAFALDTHEGSPVAQLVTALDADCGADSPSWAEDGSTRPEAWTPCDRPVTNGTPGPALDPSDVARHRALVLAISAIIWRCRPGGTKSRPAFFVVPSGSLSVSEPGRGAEGNSSKATTQSIRVDGYPVLLPPDAATDRLTVLTCDTLSSLVAAVEAHSSVFTSPGSRGLMYVLMSCIQTRGCGSVTAIAADASSHAAASGVLADVDAGTLSSVAYSGLIGSYAYASQEVVNLLLCGRAVTNVFDGHRVLGEDEKGEDGDSVVLKGVSQRCDVGFASVLTCLDLQEVGRCVSCPRCPVWVCFGESHYSLLFAAPKACRWPALQEGAGKPKYSFGRKRAGPVFAASSEERCVGLAACGHWPQGEQAGSTWHETEAEPETVQCDVVYVDGLAKQDELLRLTVQLIVSQDEYDWAVLGGHGKAGDTAAARRACARAGIRPSEASSLDLWVAALGKGGGQILSWNETDPWESMQLDMKSTKRR